MKLISILIISFLIFPSDGKSQVQLATPSDSSALEFSEKFDGKEFVTQVVAGYAYSGLMAAAAVGTTMTISSHSSQSSDGPGILILSWIFYSVYSLTTPLIVHNVGDFSKSDKSIESHLGNTYLWGSLTTILTLGTLTPVGSALGYQMGKTRKFQE